MVNPIFSASLDVSQMFITQSHHTAATLSIPPAADMSIKIKGEDDGSLDGSISQQTLLYTYNSDSCYFFPFSSKFEYRLVDIDG